MPFCYIQMLSFSGVGKRRCAPTPTYIWLINALCFYSFFEIPVEVAGCRHGMPYSAYNFIVS